MEIKFRAIKDDMSDCKFVYGNLSYGFGDCPQIQENKAKLFTTCLKGTEGQMWKPSEGLTVYTEDLIMAECSPSGSKVKK